MRNASKLREKRANEAVDIAFITVNYNTIDCIRWLADFFYALKAPFTFSLTVVDNNSQDGSQEYLRSRPEIDYIQSGENLGYGRAINRGVDNTQSKYVCVTNSDVLLNREALIALWRFLEERPDMGVCAPRITYENGRDQGMVFQPSLFSQYAEWYAKVLARRVKLKIQSAAEPLEVPGVMGAFFLIRRSAVPAPTLFDEEFFFFHEDIALAHTLYGRGVRCAIVPAARIVHIGGKSRSESAVRLFFESKYLYLRKFYGSRHAKAICLIDRMQVFRKWGIYSLCALVSGSERIQAKQRYYETAWKTVR